MSIGRLSFVIRSNTMAITIFLSSKQNAEFVVCAIYQNKNEFRLVFFFLLFFIPPIDQCSAKSNNPFGNKYGILFIYQEHSTNSIQFLHFNFQLIVTIDSHVQSAMVRLLTMMETFNKVLSIRIYTVYMGG